VIGSPPVIEAAAESNKSIAVRADATRALIGNAPGGWHRPSFDDRAWPVVSGSPPPRAGLGPGSASSGDTPGVGSASRGSLYLRTHFDIDGLASVRLIELRVVYRDGFVAFLNGVELTRRNVPTAPQAARPLVAHGAEPERIFLPLPLQGPSLRSRDNVLALEIRPAVGRSPGDLSIPTGQVAIAAVSGVRIVRGPYLIAPTDGAVSVAWETDLVARGKVHLDLPRGSSHGHARSVAAAKSSLRQVVRLDGLLPGRRYGYRVEVNGTVRGDNAASAAFSFETAPSRGRPLRFIVYGDMRAPGHAAHAQIVAAIQREQPALVVNTGDLVATGGEESAWQRYFDITAFLGATTPVTPALGNHESYQGGSARSWTLFGLRSASPIPGTGYTSFDWGGTHIVILDSNHPDLTQRSWLVRDLALARKRRAPAIFAICHDGPWSHGIHGGSRAMERDFAPVLAAGGVDVLFSGHDHLYERGIGVTAAGSLPYVVSGGGGAPLYNPTCEGAVEPLAVANSSQGSAALESGNPGGARLPPCPAYVAVVAKTYHYVVVEVGNDTLRLCPRLPDGGAIEACIQTPLRSRHH
jgi:hypothetical protein